MNANANVENIGSRYLFDKNETGLTLEDNLITTLEWNIQEKGHLTAFEYAGGNYIKLTKIPKGIKVYWNTKNDRASAMLLDDINRGVKVSKQNKNGQLMTYRNYYLWSEGTLAEDETNPNIILEFTGKGVEVEYLLGSATEVQLLADQFDTLNKNLESMVASLSSLEISAEANANQLVEMIPEDFNAIVSTQIFKATDHVSPDSILPYVIQEFQKSTVENGFTMYLYGGQTANPTLSRSLTIKSNTPAITGAANEFCWRRHSNHWHLDIRIPMKKTFAIQSNAEANISSILDIIFNSGHLAIAGIYNNGKYAMNLRLSLMVLLDCNQTNRVVIGQYNYLDLVSSYRYIASGDYKGQNYNGGFLRPPYPCQRSESGLILQQAANDTFLNENTAYEYSQIGLPAQLIGLQVPFNQSRRLSTQGTLTYDTAFSIGAAPIANIANFSSAGNSFVGASGLSALIQRTGAANISVTASYVLTIDKLITL